MAWYQISIHRAHQKLIITEELFVWVPTTFTKHYQLAASTIYGKDADPFAMALPFLLVLKLSVSQSWARVYKPEQKLVVAIKPNKL